MVVRTVVALLAVFAVLCSALNWQRAKEMLARATMPVRFRPAISSLKPACVLCMARIVPADRVIGLNERTVFELLECVPFDFLTEVAPDGTRWWLCHTHCYLRHHTPHPGHVR